MVQEMAGVRHGTLLLADISGYTAFLQAVGAAHSEEMARTGVIPEAYPLMATLLDDIVGGLVPPFQLSKTEGDAVFAFSAANEFELHGEELLGRLDVCYRNFHDRIDAMNAAIHCGCDACTMGIDLDLKFILHEGGYVLHQIAGRQELLGPDVNLVHRLLKNHASQVVGKRAYTLFTSTAAEALGVPVERGAYLSETYEHLAPIDAYAFTFPTASPGIEPRPATSEVEAAG